MSSAINAVNTHFKPADYVTPPGTPRNADKVEETPSPFKRFERQVIATGEGVAPPNFANAQEAAFKSLGRVSQEKGADLVSRNRAQVFSKLTPKNPRSAAAHRQALTVLSNYSWVPSLLKQSEETSPVSKKKGDPVYVINATHVFEGEQNGKGQWVGKHHFSPEELKAAQAVVTGGRHGVYAAKLNDKWSTCFPETMSDQVCLSLWIDAHEVARKDNARLKRNGDFWMMGYQGTGTTNTFFPLLSVADMVADQAAYRITENVIVGAAQMNPFIKLQLAQGKARFETPDAFYVDIGPMVANRLNGLDKGVLVQVPRKQ